MASKQVKLTLASFWLEDQGLSFFLASLVIMIIFVPMVGAVTARADRSGLHFRRHARLGHNRNHPALGSYSRN